jgi:isochorismate pyruvate lyase
MSTSPASPGQGKEPRTDSGPVRRFRDPAYRPLAANLAEVRANIDRLDDAIVALLAERAMYVKDAARFKRDAYQVSAPARQAEVFTKVRALAAKHDRGFEHLPDVVEAAYRALVAAFIANEQEYFNQTETIGNAQ